MIVFLAIYLTIGIMLGIVLEDNDELNDILDSDEMPPGKLSLLASLGWPYILYLVCKD